MPDTAPLLNNSNIKFLIGTRCTIDDMVIVPLLKPAPFGVAKVVSVDADKLTLQWYTAKGNSATTPWFPMWRAAKGNSIYANITRRCPKDTPYTSEGDQMIITQPDIALHSFKLTKGNKLSDDILDECSANLDIWWKRKRPPK